MTENQRAIAAWLLILAAAALILLGRGMAGASGAIRDLLVFVIAASVIYMGARIRGLLLPAGLFGAAAGLLLLYLFAVDDESLVAAGVISMAFAAVAGGFLIAIRRFNRAP